MGSYRKDGELEQGFELLFGRVDFLGYGFSAEELFPEFAEEDERVGINLKEYDERINSMGFLKCIDGLNPDKLFFSDSPGVDEHVIIRLMDRLKEMKEANISVVDHPEFLFEEDADDFSSDRDYIPYNSTTKFWSNFFASVIVSDSYKKAKKLSKKNDFVMLLMPNGAAAFL